MKAVAKNTEFDLGTLQITTFHSFCAEFLKRAPFRFESKL